MVAVKTDDRPILILGAGINGAALARELILNDFPVCVVDQGDLAGGTTAWSSRLIHGGLRYLEYSEFDLVRESLRERNLLLKLAPQFVRPLRLYVPTSNRFGGLATSLRKFFHFQRKKPSKRDIDRGLWLIRMGLHFYDAYAQDEVDPEQYRWLCSYSDAQIVFPERFVAALLTDAAEEAQRRGISFEMFNYHEARLDGRQVTIRARDNKTPGEEEASTGPVVREFEPVAIVNATGAWVDLTLKRLKIPSRRLMGGTKGSHFVTSHQGLRDALKGQGIYAEAADDRPVFVLPLGKDYTLVGTTDVRYTGNPGKAIPTDEELDYLVDTVNHIVPGTPLTRDDIDFHYAGVRPLPYTDATTTASITRRHWLERADHAEVPTYSVIGGKLTTCRSLAEESAHELAKVLRPDSPYEAKSIDRPIPGGEDYPSNKAELEATWEKLAAESCFDPQQIESMWLLCGTRVRKFLAQDGQLSSELLVGTDLPLDFVRWSIRHEWVRRVDDLVERRLMLLYQPSLSEATLRRLGDLLIEERGISQEEADSQVQATIDRLRDHFGKRLTATAIE
ncbi:Glycerol-3-phosphate dehydrogenase [Durusdinium trenchii]|uniref:glycerol-3-phosphate dehydrogenase n=1 Tax=Durusdinium trenchii TaxID=1381693 RepID=A0ABP0N249_9DINO